MSPRLAPIRNPILCLSPQVVRKKSEKGHNHAITDNYF